MCCEFNHKCSCDGTQLKINWKEYEEKYDSDSNPE